ncbi:MAG: tautomerase family protein [Rhodococcus sp. (in: high G+C Gram-positive bacteria)]
MPVAHFHLVDGTFGDAERGDLLRQASATYAEILECPVERVRVFVVRYDPADCAVGGTAPVAGAPYFTAIVLAGRPLDQRQRLLSRLTDVVEGVLGVDRAVIRGQIVEVQPENWSIAGVPASGVRADEITARA